MLNHRIKMLGFESILGALQNHHSGQYMQIADGCWKARHMIGVMLGGLRTCGSSRH